MERQAQKLTFIKILYFLDEILYIQSAISEMSPRADSKSAVRLLYCRAYAVWASALSWVDGLLTGYFPSLLLYEFPSRLRLQRSHA